MASVVYQYQPKVLAKERDRLENPFGFVVTAYRSDPEINTAAPGPTMKPLAWLARSLRGTVRHREGCARSLPDPRLREVVYDPRAVVTVPVKRGVVTLVVLDADEAITEVAAGLGGDCTKADAAWCVAAQPGGRNLFVKAKSSASAANNLAVVTDRRTHTFRFVVLADGDPKPPVYRLVVKAPPRGACPAPGLRDDVRSSRCRCHCRRLRRRSRSSRNACRPSRR